MKTHPKNTLLSAREAQVIYLLAYEYSSKEIAKELSLSFETIRSHRKNLFSKLNVKNVAGLVRVACEKDLLTDPKINS